MRLIEISSCNGGLFENHVAVGSLINALTLVEAWWIHTVEQRMPSEVRQQSSLSDKLSFFKHNQCLNTITKGHKDIQAPLVQHLSLPSSSDKDSIDPLDFAFDIRGLGPFFLEQLAGLLANVRWTR